jgi:hypothetical protein
MKVLIQNPLTLSYIETERKWTHDADAALDFKDSRSAVRYCSEHDLLDMEIVLKFPQDRYDVHMPAWAAAPTPAHQYAPLTATSHFAA